MGPLSLPGILGGGGSGRARRLGAYAAAFLILLFARGRGGADPASREAQARAAVKAYLSLAVPLLMAILRGAGQRPGATGGPGGAADRAMAEAVSLLGRLLKRGAGEGSEALLEDIGRKLALAGFEAGGPPEPGERLIWSEELKESYDTFGRVRAGQPVTVEEWPVLRNGEVIRKGQVVPG
jgi:hypothetical protein